jgi:hypothetical protein
LATPPGHVRHGEVPRRPALPPAPDLAAGEADASPGVGAVQRRILVEEQGQLAALDLLEGGGALPHLGPCLSHEVIGEQGAECGAGTWHAKRTFVDETGAESAIKGLYAIARTRTSIKKRTT